MFLRRQNDTFYISTFLLVIWYFWYLLHSNSWWWVDIILLFLIGTHVWEFSCVSCSKPCRNYSVFSFHVVGRHCSMEILFHVFLFFSLEMFHILFHDCFPAWLERGPDPRMTYDEGDVASLATMSASSLSLIPRRWLCVCYYIDEVRRNMLNVSFRCLRSLLFCLRTWSLWKMMDDWVL